MAVRAVLTGFACVYVSMDIPRNHAERGVVLLGGCALAFFRPDIGLAIAVVTTLILLGWKDAPPELEREPDPFMESSEPAAEAGKRVSIGKAKQSQRAN